MGKVFIPWIFLFIEPMVIFTTWVKIYSTNYFCNERVGVRVLGEFLSSEYLWLYSILNNVWYLLYSVPAVNTTTAPALLNGSNVESAPAMKIDAPIQATSDTEPTMVIITPRRDFWKAKVMYVQPVQTTSPPGNDQLVLWTQKTMNSGTVNTLTIDFGLFLLVW